MAAGMFEARERIERDGYLVCFAGERMTMAEAEHRGLVAASAEEPSEEHAGDAEAADELAGDVEAADELADEPSGAESRAAELAASLKADELRDMAKEMGLDVPNGANKSVLAAAIAAAEAAGA